MIKKSLMMLCMFIILSSFVLADKIEVSTTKEVFAAGEAISLKVSLYDNNNNPINAEVAVILEDAEKIAKIEQTISSNKLVNIDLGEKARHGYWKITAKYNDLETTSLFSIEMNELAKLNIEGDKLIITNIGNSRYTKTVQIIIGETIGTKKLDLEVGEETSFRLIAPDGTYNVRVTDGKTTITKTNVALTGNVIGILDERLTSGSNPVTGTLKPGETDESFYSSVKNRNFVYIFILVIIGAGILLAIERRYRKKI